MSYKGIDVSHYDGNINWRIVKEHIDFAILRLGWIGNTHHELDTKFEIYYNECKREGIPIGIYVYNYCNTQERAESGAKWAVNQLKGKSIDLPVYIDMEDSKIEHLGKVKLTNICIAFNTVIENAGYWAGVYANLNWYTNYLNKDIIKERYTTWIADYGVSEDRFEGQYDMLQYSETGRVPGISSNVDMNIMYRDLINEIKGSGTDPDPDPGTDKKTIEELAKEEHLILLCGHYEGIDQRVIDKIVDEEISIGDYVLTGGEIPAMVLIDSVSRYVDGVLTAGSTHEESFSSRTFRVSSIYKTSRI